MSLLRLIVFLEKSCERFVLVVLEYFVTLFTEFKDSVVVWNDAA